MTFVDLPGLPSGAVPNGTNVARDTHHDDGDGVPVHYSQIKDETITIHGAKSHHSSQVRTLCRSLHTSLLVHARPDTEGCNI